MRTIEILKVDMDILEGISSGLKWPKFLPRLDGAMLCYKQGSLDALSNLTTLLRKNIYSR